MPKSKDSFRKLVMDLAKGEEFLQTCFRWGHIYKGKTAHCFRNALHGEGPCCYCRARALRSASRKLSVAKERRLVAAEKAIGMLAVRASRKRVKR